MQRMVDTDVWRKSARFAECDPLERYLFLYLITNEHVNLCGAYEMRLDEIGLYTGLDHRQTLPQMLRRLEDVGLAIYRDGWVVIPKYTAKMSLGNPKVRKGVESGIAALPEHIRSLIIANDCQSSAMDSQSSGSPDLVFDSDIDSDSDSDYDSDSEECSAAESPDVEVPVPPAGGEAGASLSALKDTLAQHYQARMTEVFPHEGWSNVAAERKHCGALAKRTRALLELTPFETDIELANAILSRYMAMIRRESSEYWRNAPFSPSGLATRWDKVTTALAREYERAAKWRTA